MNKLFTGLALSFILALSWQPASAATQPLDRVAAVVDNDAIMESEVRRRLAEVQQRLRQRGIAPPPADILRQQVVEQLVLENIQLQLGERTGVRIDDNTLNETLSRIAAQNRLTLAQFREALERDGISYEAFREQIRDEMIITRVRQRQVSNRIQISDQEVENFLASERGRLQTAAEYRLGHILIPVPEQARPAEIQRAQRQATEIYQQLQAGASFEQLAVGRSAGPNALRGGDLGWRKQIELPTLFADLTPTLQVGEVAGPIRSPSGFHIIKLLDRRGGDTHMVEQTRVRHILIQPTEIRSEQQARALIHRLYQRLRDGEDFAELARSFSDDKASALNGGELGWVHAEDMVPAFRDVMQASAPNQLSRPFRSRYGWHILQVQERRQKDVGAQFQKNQARQLIFQRKFEEELQNWLREIRDSVYVEIRA